MLYLGLAIISSMLISVLMRASEKHGGTGMLAANYFMCCILACCFSGWGDLFPADAGVPVALGMGAVNGLLYLGGFVLLKWNIARNGVVLPATFMKLGVLVPTLAAITVFGETPRMLQILGIIAAVAAIIIMHGGTGEKRNFSMPGLIIMMLCSGGGDVMSKVYEEYGPGNLKDQFLLYTFISALVMCVVLCVLQKQRFTLRSTLLGMIIGVPNYLCSRFLLLALAEVPAMVVYPSFSVGTIVLVAAAGALLFRERLGRRKLIALGIILAALVLLNL